MTPIKVQQFRTLLQTSGYDRLKSDELIQGFTEGFDIGYWGPVERQNTSDNLPLRVGSRTELWNKVMKEVKESHYAGPFE